MKWMQLLARITPFCDQMYTFLNLCDNLIKFLEVKLTKWLYYFYTIDGNKAPWCWKRANNGGKNRWDTSASSGASFFAWWWTARDHAKGTDGRRSVSPVVSFPPSFEREFSSKEGRLGTRQDWIGAGGGGEAVTFPLHFARHHLRAHARTLPLGSAFKQGNVCIGQLYWLVAGLLAGGRSAASKERLQAPLTLSPLLGWSITSCSPFYRLCSPSTLFMIFIYFLVF